MNSHLTDLIAAGKRIATLGSCAAVLGWDQETYMPTGAIEHRANQIALLSTLAHEQFTGPDYKAKLAACVDLETGTPILADLSPTETVLLKELYRDWRLACCLPTSFVEAFSTLKSQAQHAWQTAKETDDFSHFAPHLTQLIEKVKQKAAFYGYKDHPYDALLDEYEPGMTVAVLKPLFAELKTAIVTLLNSLQAKPHAPFLDLGQFTFPKDLQWDFGISVLKDMGYDFNRGRQDISSHPFTTEFHPTDVRITTRLHPNRFMEAFSSTVHEGGHALYEQGLPLDWYGTPLCQATSLGIHESQSRLWENLVAKSLPFWEGYYPKLQALMPDPFRSISLRDFYRSINQARPSLIRVESDELTYNLHILIRFELELALISGELAVADLPEAWNTAYEKTLGIRPTSNATGVLQDVHWSMGAIGYFPTYTLGNLYSAQLFEAAKSAIPTLETSIQNGQLAPLTQWLRTHVHAKGRQLGAEALVRGITGSGLSIQPFMTYLTSKFDGIYS
ncbi:MAG: carboxypeptidase M32 [Candidatus Margulisiibacteriota bacterium]